MTETERVLKNDIEVIITTTLESLGDKNIFAIYLYGGYGRGEGSWVIEKEEGDYTVRPYNDYDIALIVKKKFNKNTLNKLEVELKQRIDIKWIDLCQYTTTKMKLFTSTIKNIDFKYASRWIYGQKDLLELIPELRPENIKSYDIKKLYFTRIWTLVGSLPPSGLKMMMREDEMFFRNQMAKCVLAIVDVVLIQNRLYHVSYRERVDRFCRISKDQVLIELAEWALSEKLRPRSCAMKQDEVIELFLLVKGKFFEYFFPALSKHFKSSIRIPADIIKPVLRDPIDTIKHVVKLIIRRDKSVRTNMWLVILQSYIAYYYPHFQEDTLMFIRSLAQSKINSVQYDIELIRIEVADFRTRL